MRIGPWTIGRTTELEAPRQKAVVPQLHSFSSHGGWWPIVRESFTGAWQRNVEVSASSALSFYAVYSCVRLISTDMGKMCLRLVQQDQYGVWTETDSPAFSPVLRRPNRYQTINKLIESWILSKLLHGNAYVLKGRDQRNVVTHLYVLDPTRVTPMVTASGDVYYELKRDDLSGQMAETVVVPAREIIHDTMITPYHPMVGVSPIFACGIAADQGLSIQMNARSFFSNGSFPGGIVLVPGAISDETGARLKAAWETNYGGDNMGRVAILSDGMTYQPSGFVNAHDSQLIEQLKMTAEQVCSAFGVPPYLVDIGPPPPYANFEPLLLKYHSQCIQSLATNFEKSYEHGVGIDEKVDGVQYGVEFDIDDLIWMDAQTRVNSAKTSIEGGGMSINEARWKFHGYGPMQGGEMPYLQNQMWPIQQLAERPTTAAPALPDIPMVADDTEDDDADEMDRAASFASVLNRKCVEHGLYAA